MNDSNSDWQAEARRKFDAEAATDIIQGINELAREDTSKVLSDFVFDLNLSLRQIRYLVERLQLDTTPESRSTILFSSPVLEDGVPSNITLEQYSEQLLKEVVAVRQIADFMRFFVAKLAERSVQSNN